MEKTNIIIKNDSGFQEKNKTIIAFVFHLLKKLMPDNYALPDEIECLNYAAAEPQDYILDTDIDWENLEYYAE
jgi:hypothetical protein